jgi:hypothetical protein
MSRKMEWVVSIWGAMLMVVLSATILEGGIDMKLFYIKFAAGCLSDCRVLTPYFLQWFLYPLTWLPESWLWPVWSTVTLFGILGVLWAKDYSPVVIFSFPVVGLFWYGQIDVIVIVGLALLTEPKLNPHLRGLGLFMALVKPHLSLFIMGYILLSDYRQAWRLLVVPMLGFIISLFIYGFFWPVVWAHHLGQSPMDSWRLASAMWPGLWLYAPLLLRQKTVVQFSPLALPNVSYYDYSVFLALAETPRPWETVALSYLVIIVCYPLLGHNVMLVAPMIPISLLISQAVFDKKEWFYGHQDYVRQSQSYGSIGASQV